MEQEIVSKSPKSSPLPGDGPVPITTVESESVERISTGILEVDRVLGGGMVPNGYFLLGGDPGIGKSTLLLQIASYVSQGGPVLYVTAEESRAQTKLRASRLGPLPQDLYIMAEGNVDRIEDAIRGKTWRLVVVDSLQTVYDPEIESAPGSVGQVRGIAAKLMRIAKEVCPIFLVGHVNKEGSMRPAS
jgi:DNA repair protein RadA/Sms